MTEIGGYFELELPYKGIYHETAISLNSGRNAFKYILQAQKITKVYIPVFICNSIIEPLEELGISFSFYNINEKFEITQEIELKKNEKLLYVNYYGLKSNYIDLLINQYMDKLIIDNTQAFFDAPYDEIDTIYSPRKFFGVSDGGYLYTQNTLVQILEYDSSIDYVLQLLGRIDDNASHFYNDYLKAERRLTNQPLKGMSKLTSRILSSIDYTHIKKTRQQNFEYLHKELGSTNCLTPLIDEAKAALFVYPYLPSKNVFRDKLISEKVYIAKYWTEVLERTDVTSIETNYVNNLLPLPIDQRYSMEDLSKILKIIKGL